MDERIGYLVHHLALNLLRGPSYRATVEHGTGPGGEREIVITIPFPPIFDDATMDRLMEEIAMGIYMPRSDATKGLIERKDKYISDNPPGGSDGPDPV